MKCTSIELMLISLLISGCGGTLAMTERPGIEGRLDRAALEARRATTRTLSGSAPARARPVLVPQAGQKDYPKLLSGAAGSDLVVTRNSEAIVQVWSLRTGLLVRRLSFDPPADEVSLSGDGRRLAVETGPRVVVLDLATGQEVFQLESPASSAETMDWAVSRLRLSADGAELALCTWGGFVGRWSVATGAQLHFMRPLAQRCTALDYSPDGSLVVTAWDDRDLRLYETATGTLRWRWTPAREKDGTLDLHFTPDGRQLVGQTSWGGVRQFDVVAGESLGYDAQSSTIPGENGLVLSLDGRHLAALVPAQGARVWAYGQAGALHSYPNEGPFNTGLLGIAFVEGGRRFVTVDPEHRFTIFNTSSGEALRTFKPAEPDNLGEVAIAPGGRYALISLEHPVWFDLQRGRIASVFPQTGPFPQHRLIMAASGQVGFNRTHTWDLVERKVLAPLEVEGVHYSGISPDGRFVLVQDGFDLVKMNAQDGRVVWRSYAAHPDHAAFSPDGALIAASASPILILDATNGREVKHFTVSPDESPVAFSPDSKLLFAYDDIQRLQAWDWAQGTRSWSLQARAITGRFIVAGNGLIAGVNDCDVVLIEGATGQLRATLRGDGNRITSLSFSDDSRRLLTAGKDGRLRYWEVERREELASIFIDGTHSATIIPDGSYLATKGMTRLLGFELAGRSFPFDQFDLRFNRPDRVVARLGRPDDPLVALYERARQRRLQRMGLNEADVNSELELPRFELLTERPPLKTAQKRLTLKARASDLRSPLTRLLVTVNDVPIHGAAGLELAGKTQLEIPIELELVAGLNAIELSVRNALGQESLRSGLSVEYTGDAARPELYLVAIGVSKYRDARFDLTYAAKDAQDLAVAFARRSKQFGKLHPIVITDAEATRERILAVRERLLRTRVEDQVVLFVAGHGLLDGQRDYYFATTDVDFDAPAGRGLAYEQFEGLLDGIPARRKLLLMDSCHSGEVDPGEAPLPGAVVDEASGGGKVAARSVGQRGLTLQGTAGLSAVAELLGELFAELRKGAGAQVISSAGGAEFALESDTWRNGVFTFAVLEALQSGRADADRDGQTRVSELRDYVGERVRGLTQGRQSPTARIELRGADFPVF